MSFDGTIIRSSLSQQQQQQQQPGTLETGSVTFDLASLQWIGDAPTNPATERIPDLIPYLLSNATYPVLMYAKHLLRHQAFVHNISPAISVVMNANAVIESRQLVESLVFPFLQDAPIEWASENRERIEQQVRYALIGLNCKATSAFLGVEMMVRALLEEIFQFFLQPDAAPAVMRSHSVFTFCTNLQGPLAPAASSQEYCAYTMSKFVNSLDMSKVYATIELVFQELESFVRNPNALLFADQAKLSTAVLECFTPDTNIKAVVDIFMAFVKKMFPSGILHSIVDDIVKKVEEMAPSFLACFDSKSDILGDGLVQTIQDACAALKTTKE